MRADDIAKLIYACRTADAIREIALLSKDQLEDGACDLLQISVRVVNGNVRQALLDKGLRSGHALDMAAAMGDANIVGHLLNAGVHASDSAIAAATRCGYDQVAAQVRKAKEDHKNEFRIDLDF